MIRLRAILLFLVLLGALHPSISNAQSRCITGPTLEPPSITSKKPVPPPSVPESAASSLSALQNAAEDGDPIAQWKLGRMHGEGNGVAQNDLLALDYFSRIANAHGNVSPSAPEAQIVANAFVALGRYYLTGIPNSKITSDPERAREMFSYAASHFGNADAQYDLARLYLKDAGTSRDDFRHGARWPAPPKAIARQPCRCCAAGSSVRDDAVIVAAACTPNRHAPSRFLSCRAPDAPAAT